MARGGRLKIEVGKARRWRKGQSGSSNPETKKHRQAAKGRFGTHLSQPLTHSSLTEKALASHDAAIKGEDDTLMLARSDEIDSEEDKDSLTLASIKSVTSVATGTVYSLMETAHPVFRKLRRFWNSPVESHKEVCAVLAAVSEVVKCKEGSDTETEYFGALMTALETSEHEKSAIAVSLLLSLIMPKVPQQVLIAQYNPACKILADQLTAYETSNSTSLLISLVKCLSGLLEAQGPSTWREGYTQRIFQLLLNYTIHPKPKLRKSAQNGIVSLLREGTLSGDFHPSTSLVARHCRHTLENDGLESSTLHILGMLKDCLANFPTQHVKSLCESLLKLMTLGNSMVRTTGLKVLHGMFTSIAGPQGLNSDLCAQLVSALYVYQPSLIDAQLLQAWLTVLQSAYIKLSNLTPDLFVANLPRVFVTCVRCLLSNKDTVKAAAASVMETLLKEYVPPILDQLKVQAESSEGGRLKDKSKDLNVTTDSTVLVALKTMFKSLESGLKYKYCTSWDHVLKVFALFYQVVGSLQQCQSFMTKSLVTICDLRASPDFRFKSDVDTAFGAAVGSMGVRVVLKAVPLQLDPDHKDVVGTHNFPRSWMLPVLRDSIEKDELSYFTEHFLQLAGKLRAKSMQVAQSGNPLEGKLYDTLQHQIWRLLPGFCSGPVDLYKSFGGIARILGTALKERAGLRPIVCYALKLLVESSEDSEDRKELARFSKNFLPIFFELYINTADEGNKSSDRGPLIACIRAYVSITDEQLLRTFLTSVLSKVVSEDVPTASKQLLLDLVQSFTPQLSEGSLDQIYLTISPLLDAGNSSMQKKSYVCLECLLSCKSPAHKAFIAHHLDNLRQLLLDSFSTASSASKKPRLKCLLYLVDHLSPKSSDFIAAILSEVILCTKEVNEKTRVISFKLLIRMGYAAQRCYLGNAEDSVTEYFVKVLAGLAGSTHMISATILTLSRLVYEFHDLLSTDFLKRLLSTVCVFLRSKTREVVRSTLEFIKVTIGVLLPDELLSHLEELVTNITSWSPDNSCHFRTTSRDILERLVRKFGYEVVAGFVPDKLKNFIAHIRKMVERQKKKKKQARENGGDKDKEDDAKTHFKPSYEELLMDSSDEEEEQTKERRPKGRDPKQKGVAQGRAWIKEADGDDPVNFLDPGVVQKVIATDPARLAAAKRPKVNPFETNQEGKLVITESEGVGDVGGDMMDDMDTNERKKRKRKLNEDEDGDTAEANGGGGHGIYRKNAHKKDYDFDYGSEYRAKKAKGDIKKKGKPDPYAYVPLIRQKLNRRKEAKLRGQFSGLLQKAKKGSAAGTKQRRKTFK